MTKAEPYEVIPIGREGESLVVIDGFSTQAAALEQMGRTAQIMPGNNHYPGHRAPAPASYLGERADLLKTILIDVFGMNSGAELIECSFSFVTIPPAQLTPIQRLPHFDGSDPGRLALLHYLCGPEEGGTSFYRHRQTGYERITTDRLESYNRALQAAVARDGLPPAQYFAGSNAAFECVQRVEAKWNRMIIYRGLSLHSGDVRKDAAWPVTQNTARLTVNTFLAERGASPA